ncbi:MAG: transketolase [Lysobacterales bacterium]
MPERKKLADAVRALSMDAVQAANSGHPGMPMGMADIAEVLWNDYVRHNPSNPQWFNRDRVVISNGHGSMLIYSVLHLAGYDLGMDQLRNFRQMDSKTAGHPEFAETPGVETTTGPLGQGLANAVGMALAESILAARFNREGHTVVDHNTYVLAGDGCLMEGISHEVCSLAGTLKLGKLICLYDDNGISIDGEVDGWFTDDTPARFRAYGWQVIDAVDGHDAAAIASAIASARENLDQPTLICCKTLIGYGSPNKEGTSATHGAPLGDDEIAAARVQLQWEHPPFEIPEDIYAGWNASEKGGQAQTQWDEKLAAYANAHPEAAAELSRRVKGQLPADWDNLIDSYIRSCQEGGASVATRKASGMALEAIGGEMPEMIGGSADLTGSNNTRHSASSDVTASQMDANYVNYGVREFGMTAMANGMALHGGFIPYTGTFLVFSDYARNAVRMSALIPAGSIHVYTHDSIGLGEDGPTHQPVEHVASLRLMPNLEVWRPCDTVETAWAWKLAVQRRDGPTALVLTRQGLPHQDRNSDTLANVGRGGYVLFDSAPGQPQLILIATGSEVGLAMSAAKTLAHEGVATRVVSMPCTSLFDRQPADYRNSVLPPQIRARLAIEAASADYWAKYTGLDGDVIGMTSYGASAPASELFAHFGFTEDNVVARGRALVQPST